MLEEESLSTWENVANVVKDLEDRDEIKIASHPLHGLKARIYLRRRRPDLATRLTRAADHRLGESILLKPVLAACAAWTLRNVPRRERR